MLSHVTATNQAQQQFVTALHWAWSNGVQLFEPGVWLQREPEIESKMLHDPDIAHAINFRIGQVAGRDWEVQPDDPKKDNARMAKEVGTKLVRGIKQFTGSRRLLARAFFHGSRWGLIHGTCQRLNIGDGKWRTWWVPTSIEDFDKNCFRIKIDNDGKRIDGQWQEFDIATGEWNDMTQGRLDQFVRHVYDNDQSTLNHGKALREALGWLWYGKTNVWQDSMSSASRFGGGITKVKVAGAKDSTTNLPNTEVQQQWIRTIQRMREAGVLVFDVDDDVELMDGNGEGWQLLGELRREMKSTVFTLVLGANLTTSADHGGSYALADVQQDSTELIVDYDREALEETLSDSLMRCIWRRNRINLYELGVADDCPRIGIVNAKRQDPEKRASVAKVLVVDMGVPIAREELYEQTGFRVPEDGEEVVEAKQVAASPWGGIPGLPSLSAPPAPPPQPQKGDDEQSEGSDRERVGSGPEA